jgi:hypothetical protein
MKLRRSLVIGFAALTFSVPAWGAHHEAGEVGKGQQKAKEKAADGREKAEDAMDRAEDAKGEAMRERRDQRKEIMDEAKSSTEPSERKGKKPWWKFWGSDESE